jgi:hypothetical protein
MPELQATENSINETITETESCHKSSRNLHQCMEYKLLQEQFGQQERQYTITDEYVYRIMFFRELRTLDSKKDSIL